MIVLTAKKDLNFIRVTEDGEEVYRKTKGVYYPIKNYYKIV